MKNEDEAWGCGFLLLALGLCLIMDIGLGWFLVILGILFILSASN